jgi:hypothetical protein
MPINRDKYPNNWEVISYQIRVERAKSLCEVCGIPDKIIVKRLEGQQWRNLSEYEQHEIQWQMNTHKLNYWQSLKKLKLTRIVLTVAHWDHDEKNNTPENLKAVCQRCHLLHDREDNKQRRIINKHYFSRSQLPDEK